MSWLALSMKLEKESGISKMGFPIYDITNAKQNWNKLKYEVLNSLMVLCACFNIFNHQDKIFGMQFLAYPGLLV